MLLYKRLMQWGLEGATLLRVHTALAEALGPLPAPHGLVHSCLQLQQQRDPVHLASLGTGAYIPTHQHTQIHTLKNNKKMSVFFLKKTKEVIQGSLPDTWFIDGFGGGGSLC